MKRSNSICSKCNSNKMMTDLKAVTYSDMNMEIDVSATIPKPQSFKRLFARKLKENALLVDVCGACGDASLHVKNHEKLWEEYNKDF